MKFLPLFFIIMIFVLSVMIFTTLILLSVLKRSYKLLEETVKDNGVELSNRVKECIKKELLNSESLEGDIIRLYLPIVLISHLITFLGSLALFHSLFQG